MIISRGPFYYHGQKHFIWNCRNFRVVSEAQPAALVNKSNTNLINVIRRQNRGGYRRSSSSSKKGKGKGKGNNPSGITWPSHLYTGSGFANSTWRLSGTRGWSVLCNEINCRRFDWLQTVICFYHSSDMAQTFQYVLEFIQDSFVPMVAVLCSEEAERVTRKNNLNFAELLRPFCRLTSEGKNRISVPPWSSSLCSISVVEKSE